MAHCNKSALILVAAAAVATCLSVAQAQPRLMNERTAVLPTYLLPDGAAADGNLAKWAGIPVSAESDQFHRYLQFTLQPKECFSPQSDDFAPCLRCGMTAGSRDLFLLVIVRDSQRYADDLSNWFAGDFVELYLDIIRQDRDRRDANWWQFPNKCLHPAEMGQFALRPRTMIGPSAVRTAGAANAWKIDYASVLVEGGVAYDIRIDANSILASLKLEQMPPEIGFDVQALDQDYPWMPSCEGWSNDKFRAFIFGDGMDHAFPTKFGRIAMAPVSVPQDQKPSPLPKALKDLYGEFPTAKAVADAAAGSMSPAALADLVYWAACQGTAFDEALAKQLMASPCPLVRENCLAALYFANGDPASVRAALAAGYQDPNSQSPGVLVLLNLLNETHKLGYKSQLRQLLGSDDQTVAFSAARAMAAVGSAADANDMQEVLDAAIASAEKGRNGGLSRAYEVFMKSSLDGLRDRVTPVPAAKATPVVEVQAANTDLPRLMPINGNNVYNAKGLLRSWPPAGPKELWRVDVGEGKAAVVEVAGKAYTAGQSDGKQWAICLQAATGKTLWRTQIEANEWKHITNGPQATPTVDGDRVYFITKFDKGYDPNGNLYCLSAADGNELWRSDPGAYVTQGDSTPLILGDILYMNAGRQGRGQNAVAVDKKTGKLLWSVSDPLKRRDVYGASASPSYQIIDGIAQVIFSVCHGAREMWGVDANTGEVTWRYPMPLHNGPIASPVAVDGRVFLAGGQGGSAFSACLQMYSSGGKVLARQVYRSEKLQNNMYNTVAVQDGAVYGFSGKSMQCTALCDGKLLWEKADKDWGTDQQLIVADGLIFALTTGNALVLAEANKTGYKELGRASLGAKLGVPQQPTLANGRLYVRCEKSVICYDVLNP